MAGLLVSVLLLGITTRAWAQPEAYNWKFGEQSGIRFPAGAGPVMSPGAMGTYEGCASISDAEGVLQCYANTETVWDRNGTIMPNGRLMGSHSSATQGVLLVRGPGQARWYYLFTVDALENNLSGGLRYSIVDMSLRGGLGDVQATNSRPLPVPGNGLVAEKLTAIRHANNRDYWIVVHGWNNNSFYAYLLNGQGISTTPVVSAIGSVHSMAGGPLSALGYLRASPNSRRLASAQMRPGGVELFDFNPTTGQVVAMRNLPPVGASPYGLEFSADNSKLYIGDDRLIHQVDITNNLFISTLPIPSNRVYALQRGPDSRIYVALAGTPLLGVIQQPNTAGPACALDAKGFTLSTGRVTGGLPNFPNAFAPALLINPVAAGCPGSVVEFSTSTVPPAGGIFTWIFDDPASGAANNATGPTATHRYTKGGTYTITLTLTAPGPIFESTQRTITVPDAPGFSLGPRQQLLCHGQTLTLSAGTVPAGTTFRWQDGSTSPTYIVRTPGRYSLQLTSLQGCTAHDSVEVLAADAPVVRLGRDTTLCGGWQSVVLRATAQPAGSTYQWQDGATTAEYTARQPGVYWLEVRNQAGCTTRDSVVIQNAAPGNCPTVTIPNIITPNNDQRNDFFVLQGLTASDWDITIYSRWGQPVYEQTSYTNSWAAVGQPAGTYYYLLRNPATHQQLRGWVEVIR
ncbi:T9SS type B sorting domain-containing protein [Hymenobacter rigui]|uniref:T9SS type B sorting domain-containing protein n=1 Tax=Hymenobacter rigui TaxID=334424 RepID=UPI0011CF09FE|nr:gliding motility-associated C-terminal domain-containing protein [Hymenobacter rigui]